MGSSICHATIQDKLDHSNVIPQLETTSFVKRKKKNIRTPKSPKRKSHHPQRRSQGPPPPPPTTVDFTPVSHNDESTNNSPLLNEEFSQIVQAFITNHNFTEKLADNINKVGFR